MQWNIVRCVRLWQHRHYVVLALIQTSVNLNHTNRWIYQTQWCLDKHTVLIAEIKRYELPSLIIPSIKEMKRILFASLRASKITFDPIQSICMAGTTVCKWEDIFLVIWVTWPLKMSFLKKFTLFSSIHSHTHPKWWHFSLLNRRPFSRTHREEQTQEQQHKERGRKTVSRGSLNAVASKIH